MTTINIVTRKEIEELVKSEIRKLEKDFYYQLQKLRSQVIDLNDIIRVLKR